MSMDKLGIPNKEYGCSDIASAIVRMMTMANLGGFIRQETNQPFLQFDVRERHGAHSQADMRVAFGGQEFIITVTPVAAEAG